MAKNKLIEIYRQKEEQAIKQAELAAQATDDYLAVKDFMLRRISYIELTPAQERIRNIYSFAYNQLLSGKFTEKEVLSLIMTEYKVPVGAAIQYLKDSKELYNIIFDVNKAWEIHVQLELNKIQMQKANARGDQKAYALLERNRIKLLDLIPEKEESTNDDFVGHLIEPQFNPALLGIDPIPEKELKKLQKDIESQFGGDAAFSIADIEFIEISNEDK